MGALGVSTTRANTSTSTCDAFALKSARAQASSVAPVVRTSSTSTIRRPWTCDFASAESWNAPCTLLARCARDSPLQQAAAQCDPALPFDGARERAGLIEAAAPGAPPVQRHRDQHVGAVEQFAAGARHPAAHRRGKIGAVVVFQRVHQRARDLIIAHRGARPRIGRRVGDRFHRQHVGTGVVDEGDAEPRTIRRLDERQFGPAFGANAVTLDRLAAGHAQGRQRDVEGEFRRARPCAADRTECTAQRSWCGACLHLFEGIAGSWLAQVTRARDTGVIASV